MKSSTPSIWNKTAIGTGDKVFFNEKSSKHSEPNEWSERVISTVHDHYVEISTGENGREVRAPFEDLRVIPKTTLTEKLMDFPIGDNHEAEIPPLLEDDESQRSGCRNRDSAQDWDNNTREAL